MPSFLGVIKPSVLTEVRQDLIKLPGAGALACPWFGLKRVAIFGWLNKPISNFNLGFDSLSAGQLGVNGQPSAWRYINRNRRVCAQIQNLGLLGVIVKGFLLQFQ